MTETGASLHHLLTISMQDNDSLLQIRDLHVSFGSVEVLHGIDLDIRPGVIHALIGESGSK